uniref:Uncharacterized protein n=1 Tax=Trieres chinensis TaxID=1514140 RepID=A0A7S1Z9P2_TRICV|mmetsp:Transcript_20671/g.41823  ORF Transcript_20671/g.41823 Transcript_20671/m.41823 type:complete len:161 (+) Transcript_20671:124-606(+)|eukprot:CAMPEP_0183304060 /NCGR_PEP_ID=MMETSP0160_2-20130417/9280_1 /TAXON_ID=2839 ORGANISM="Odontella Sinensis, Strain Grunow 1884" /NCGR_SAMPLE_ID=MMETSP0160_2 /ASSEMBLY_ACC=CAM_ASM_000250 /LENGTH=160 /DNA_ID=CAMNT_0025467047 /DNA_START=51 /DNA_END=533 /DNA_ORIENTATION=-
MKSFAVLFALAASAAPASAFAPSRPATFATRLQAETDKAQLLNDIARYEAAQAAKASRPEKISASPDGAGLVGTLGFLGAAGAALGAIVIGGGGIGELPSVSLPSGGDKPAPAPKVKVAKAAKPAKVSTSPKSEVQVEKVVKKKATKASKGPGGYDLTVE